MTLMFSFDEDLIVHHQQQQTRVKHIQIIEKCPIERLRARYQKKSPPTNHFEGKSVYDICQVHPKEDSD